MAKGKQYKVTRNEIVAAGTAMLGWKFRHQGRNENGVDCVGFLVVLGEKLNYPFLNDVEAYRRVPSAQVIRETLQMNCDEIDASEVRKGDIYLMRTGGRKPRHAALRISDDTDLLKGVEPQLIHSYGDEKTGKVVIEPVRQWEHNFVCGFRLRGLTEVKS